MEDNIMNRTILMIMFGRRVGGAELQFLELANYLSRNHRVRLLCLGGDGALNAMSVSEKLDIRVYTYTSTFSTLIGLLKACAGNIRYPAKSIVTTSFIGNVLGFIIGLFQKAKLISLQTVSVCMRYPMVDRFVLRQFDKLIAGANDIKDYLIAHDQNSNRIRVIHNWVDFSKRHTNKEPSEMKKQFHAEGKIVIGCIGRFHPQKGQIYLIRAYAKIVESFPSTVLVLVGDGQAREALENEVSNLGLKENVIFARTVTGDQYNNILNMIDIYVQPSVFEGLPRTLLDAMYMGKAIVSTDVNGNREAIKNEQNGLLVPSKNTAALTLAIFRLMQFADERIKFSTAAKMDAESHFGMSRQLAKIDQLIAKNTTCTG